MIELTDDGTLDTVLRCSDCGEEFRYNYGASELEEPEYLNDADAANAYREFVKWAIEDATEDHVCGSVR